MRRVASSTRKTRMALPMTARAAKAPSPPICLCFRLTTFQFVMNLKTATLGVKIFDNLLSLADEVIE